MENKYGFSGGIDPDTWLKIKRYAIKMLQPQSLHSIKQVTLGQGRQLF